MAILTTFGRAFVPLCLTLAALLNGATAHAAELTVLVRDAAGRAVEDAVVILDTPNPHRPSPGTFTIKQKDMQFVPFVLVIPRGSNVEFSNLDPFRHHVYSFSPARKFELKLFGKGETRPVNFDKVGPVAIGCNIHDSMQAFIQVVDTPYAARTPASGRVTLSGVPSGKFRLRVWHPRLRAPGNELALVVDTSATNTVSATVKLRTAAPMQHDY